MSVPTRPGPAIVADEPADPGTPRSFWRQRWLAVVAVILVVAATAVVAYRWGASGTPQAIPTPRPTPTPSKDPTPAQMYTAIAPSVVSIIGNARGTGLIINADATIVTARHLVAGARTITLTFADGTASTATVAGDDPTTDIAVLTPATLPSVVVPAVLGQVGRLAVGDSVLAVGDQLGLAGSATAGVVSGLDRSAPNPGGGATLTGLIQFDAAVNTGSAGGPLLDSHGQAVGIVVTLANPTAAGTFVGVGFAVPITTAAAGGGRPPQQ
jgi:S1-C subfamily serine protease